MERIDLILAQQPRAHDGGGNGGDEEASALAIQYTPAEAHGGGGGNWIPTRCCYSPRL